MENEDKISNKDNKSQENIENKEYKYVYFIDNHDKTKKLKIYLSPEYKGADTLEKLEEKDMSEIIDSSSTTIYRFKILPEYLKKGEGKRSYEVVVVAEEENGDKHNFTIEFLDVKKDYYEYDFKIKEVDILPLSYELQFDCYVEYLRKIKKLQASKENEELVLNTQRLMIGPEKKYDFLFYIVIFRECFATKYVNRHLLLFKPEKIKGLGNLPEKKLNQISNIINTIVGKPERIHIEKEGDKEKILEAFFSMALYFNLNFNKPMINGIIENEKIFEMLSPKLITYNELYKGLILPKDNIVKLIKKTNNFDEVLHCLSYVGKNIIQFLNFINEEKELIEKYVKEELDRDKNANPIIELENFVEAKKEDDINELSILINKIIEFHSSNEKIVKFSPSIFEKYIEYNDEVNLNNLILLKGIIEAIKKSDNKFKIKYKKFDSLIHDNGLAFVKSGKLKNKELLEFIQIDEFYHNKQYDKAIYRPLEILDGIDISSLNEDFFDIWKNMKFNKIFDSQKDEFLKKISTFINEMKDFSLLFSFYQISIENDYSYDAISDMQNRFIEIFNTYSDKECPNFQKDLIKLIYLSDKKKVNIKKFLVDFLQNNLDIEKINDIYLKLVEEHQDISKDLKGIIVEHLSKNKINATPSNLINLLKNCPSLRGEIFANLNKFIIKEEDFLKIEETENYKFYKGIIDNDLLKDESQYKGALYVDRIKETIKSLKEKFKNNDINFNIISIFLQDDKDKKMEDVLYERLLYMYSLNETEKENKAKECLDHLKKIINQIKKYIKDLELIYRDFVDYFPIKCSKDIDKISKLIYNIKNNKLNYFENNCQNDYLNFSKYLVDAKRREKNKKSVFYNELMKEAKNKFKDQDKNILEETEKNFNDFKKLFKPDGIYKIDKKLLEICLKPFEDNEEDLKNELKVLIDTLDIKETKSIEEIYEEILLISKVGFIFNAAAGINIFIEKIKAKRTQFSEEIQNIIMKLKEKKDINTIKYCYNKLIELNILDKKVKGVKENNYIDILIKFIEQPDSIKFLLETSIQEVGNLQELASENDNNYVTVNDIMDMGKCVEFFKNIGLGNFEDLANKDDKDIIYKIKENVPKNKDIFVYFEKYVNNYGQINMLKSSLDKSEVLKYKVQALFNGSHFILSNTKKDEDSFKCIYMENINVKEMPHQVILNKEAVSALRERALLAKKITPDYEYFIKSITEILNISSILKEICMKGYPKTIIIEVKIKVDIINKEGKEKENQMKINGQKEYYIDNILKKDYLEISEILKNILALLKEKQINGYENKPLVRFIYGSQFNLLYNHFKKIKNNNISHFLKYVTDDNYKNEVKNFNCNEKGEIIENNINDCEKFLNQVLSKNNLNLEKIYQKTLITQKNINIKLKGFFTYLCDENVEKELFQIFKFLTNNNPIAHNILLCNKDTSNEEITAFLYRAALCNVNACFLVGGLELLENEQKTYMLNLLNHFYDKEENKRESCLIFIFSDKSTDIYKSLGMKKYRKVFDIPKNSFNNEKYVDTNIEIIKSDKSGVGKSTQIKNSIEKCGKIWVYFPFGGVFTREDIIKRLKDLKIDRNCVLHLDLYNTDLTILMMEFLFSVLITRVYGQNEDIFYLSKDIQIKVEIPNTFIDFFKKFQILTLFPIKEIKITDLAPLIVPPKELDSNIEVVANYLKALKANKIAEYDLIFPKITPVDFEKESVYVCNGKKKTTAMKAEYLSNIECQKLIFESIKEKIPEPTYYQIISFINVLALQLKKLNKNFYLNAHQLILSTSMNNCLIRNFIVKSFIKLTKHFTEGAFIDLIKGQEMVHKSLFGQYDEGQDINNAVNQLADNQHEVISFKKIDPSLLFFHEGDNDQSFTIITNKKKEDQEYKDLLSLRNSQNMNRKKLEELPDYGKFTQIDFLKALQDILDIKNPIEKEPNNPRTSLKEIAGNYVFTADNFVKMILILLRIRANIPVIMMGETGCGKTSLIRKLAEMKNDGKGDNMKILNIHAGTTDNDIIDFINNKVIPYANKIAESEKEEKEKRQKMQQFFDETKIWVFLDEINTCKSMGLISELMCKHSCQGKPLPQNIVFIAACNPYRQREKKGNNKEEKIGLDIGGAHKQIKKYLNPKELENIKRKQNSNLVYTVNPLPHSLLNFVFDFGNLTKEDEDNYIRCIIKEAINNKYYKGEKPVDEKFEDNNIKKLKELASKMIIEAQNFIRSFNDKSAVSLREIRRFNIFYEFFYDYLKKRKEIYEKEKKELLYEGGDNDFYQNLDDYSMQIYGINLSIFVCYYLRITDKEKRNQLYLLMNKHFKEFSPAFNIRDFLDLPLKEEKFIVENIKLDKGIAKNRALLENLFSLFVAINNKVPIFIVGKPGCSKSLSVQLIIKSMQGSGSDNHFFKNLPKLMVHSYQGSMASTSKGVENIFKKARSVYQSLSPEDKKINIPLIFFDEMGLAEHSPNNPLKVIHSELEYDQNKGDKKVAFIGISNWILDAAKMNRGISISIPEPDEEDNKETSLTIGKSYDELLAIRYKNFFENLGKSYFEYKNYLKKYHNSDGKEDFHGNRDFYHLVKNSSRNILEKDKNNQLNEVTLLESAVDSIERNFSGIQFEDKDKTTSLQHFKKIFKQMYPDCQVAKKYDVLKRIKENINDLNSRYLLVFSKSSISPFLISSILNDEKKEYSFYIGSKFEQDLNTEEYALKVLNKIQTHMERGNILILNNLESVYPAMYDLFNQNFTVLSNKNYSRLAVGSNTNTFAYVNNDFRCIVSVDIDQINNEEAPFLNRFEKHIISFEYLLNQELIQEAEKIKSTLDSLVKLDMNMKAINYDLSKLFINSNLEEVQALVYQAYKEGKKKEQMMDYVLEKISLTLPQDIIVNMKISGLKTKKPKVFKKVMELYNKGEHSNFSNFLKKINNYRSVVYTFSNNLEDIKNINGINNPLLGKIEEENIKEIQINSLKSENDLERKLNDFFNENNKKICLIKFLPYEGTEMNYVKYYIENKEKDYENKPKKLFVFIVHLTRVLKKEISDREKKTLKEQIEISKKILEETLSNLSGFYQIFIDNLNGDQKLKIEKIIEMKKKELFENLVNVDEELCRNIYKSISYMKYNIITPYKGLNQENYVDELIQFIYKNRTLRNLINNCILKQTLNENDDIIKKVFKDKDAFNGTEIEIISVIKRHLSKLYTSQLTLFYFKAEKDQFFSSLLSNAINQRIWGCKINKDGENEKILEEDMEINIGDKNEDVTTVEKLARAYLEQVIFNDGMTRVNEKQYSNKLDITFGLNIPGIKPVFDRILKSVKENILKNYKNNENELRNEWEGEEIDEVKQTYFKDLDLYNTSLINILNKENQLNNIINIINNNKEEKNKLYTLIINDYYTLFLSNCLSKKKNKKEEEDNDKLLVIDNIDNNKRFLNLMVILRNNKINEYIKENKKEKEIIEQLAITINWIESYSEEISSIQQIFLNLSMKIPEFYEQIEEIINKKYVKYEISDRNKEYTSIVNEVFFLSLDSILRIITSKEEIYELPLDDFFDLINTNKEVLQSALQLEASLTLRSKEVFSLQEILKLINAFYLNKIANVENIKKIIQYFGSQTISFQNERQRKLKDIFDDFFKFLLKTFGKQPPNKNFDFYKILGFILLNEFVKINYDDFRELILEKILENNNLIKNSSQIIKIIFENVIDCEPTVMIKNLKVIKSETSKNFKKLNHAKNEFLDEIIMNIFEAKISAYFELIPNLDEEDMSDMFNTYYQDFKAGNKSQVGIIFDNSLDIFEETILFLDSYTNSNYKNNMNDNIHLSLLYSIVYTKMYLSKLVYFIFDKFQESKSIQKIKQIINKIKNPSFAKVIKIYIFKLFFNLMDNNYEEFQSYEFKEKGIDFYKELDQVSNKNKKNAEVMLSYFFLPLEEEDYKKYSEESKVFLQNSTYDLNNKEIADLIEKDGIDIFLCVSINKVISNLGLKKYETKDVYKNFSKYAKSLFSDKQKLNLSYELCNLLDLFYDSHTYMSKMKPKIPEEKGVLNQKVFEILLYGFRYCVNTLDNYKNKNEEFLFHSLLSRNYSNIINKSFIPGNDNKEDLHITSLESIEFHFRTFPDAYGCYVCSCGLYYNIDPCGFPTTNRTFNCQACGQKCGWGPKKVKGGAANHGMIIRDGHLRLFKDKAQKEGQMRRWKDPDENIPNMILEEYKNKIIEPIRKKPASGFNSVSRDYFENQNKKIRNLSNIGYRLLNFISYCHLFFNYCMGNIPIDILKNYLIQNTDIIKIIEIDWDKLKEALQQKNINSIQIFMNMIFKQLSKLISECKCLSKDEERLEFEEKVEKLITQCIKDYPEYSKKYNDENQQQLSLDINSLKTLVTELIKPTDNIYSEKEYPLFKYFIYTKYKTEEDMVRRMDNKEKYPLLNQLITGNPAFKKLKYLPAFNEFTNYMVENYSFKISRDDAKKRDLNNEEIAKTNEFKDKFNNFLKSWNEIKSEAKKYKCRPEMPVKELSIKDKLICFLNDNGELLNGMYLASACQNFIEWQNSFLQPIADANAFNGLLHHYVDTIRTKIPVQDAKPDQIVLIQERFRKSRYKDLNDIIYTFSERNIFSENGKINYSDYNTFVYDYASMEEELGKIVLPGVCLFEGEDDLNFITFWGEGFRGGKSQMLSNFYSKYPQIDLDDKEKEIIISYIDKMNKDSIRKYNIKYDFKDFFGSMQILIFYLTEKGIMKEDEKIVNILNSAPGYFKLSDDCRNFFYGVGENLTVNKLMNLFFFFEHLCFEDLAETLQNEYKKEIPEDLKDKIRNKLLKKEEDPNAKYTIKDLGAAVRRLISRYLAGRLEVTDINEDRDLGFELSREDLWEEKIAKLDDLMDLIGAQLYEFKLKVGQAYAFYNLIGEEDRKSIISGIKKEKENENKIIED